MVRSNVKILMKKKGVTIRSLVATSGLSDKTILRARGAQIIDCRLGTLQTLARHLDCKIKDLFKED